MGQSGPPQKCKQCDTINAPEARFCSVCGNPLSSSTYTQTQSQYPSSQQPSTVYVDPSSQQPNTAYGDPGSNPYPMTAGSSDPYNPYAPTTNPYGYGAPPPPPSTAPNRTRRSLIVGGIVGGVVAVAAAGTGVYVLASHRQSSSPPPLPTLMLNFTYSTEKTAWMQEAIPAFNKSGAQVNGKTVQVIGNPQGSVDVITGLLAKNLVPMPHAWSPASDLELQQLSNSWQKQYGSQNILAGQSEPLARSPLVFAVWKDRAQVLLKHYPSIDWPAIHNALTLPGWSSIGGPGIWQAVKFGQTRPDSSNSGLLTVTLMAYSFYKKSRGLSIADIANASFQTYFSDIETAVQKFGNSSGTYLQNEVIPNGPSSYDLITTYESLVITNQQQAQSQDGEPLQPYYPSLNIVSNHPFAILNGDWITPDDQLAAQTFRDFLLSNAQQKTALLNGFRPARIDNPIEDRTPGNPFQSQAVKPFLSSIPRQLPPQVQTPDGAVIERIINLWKQKYGSAPTAN